MKLEGDLNTIRSLIERREIYRSVFTRVALIIGGLSILAAATIYCNNEITLFLGRPIRPREFAVVWLIIFAVGAAVLTLLLLRVPRADSDTVGSARAQMILNVIAPYLLISAAFTVWFFATGYLGAAELDLVTVWICSYGLMLLCTGLFAPRPVALLGWALLLTGLAVPSLADKIDNLVGSVPTVLMGMTFGIYHLVFAGTLAIRDSVNNSSA